MSRKGFRGVILTLSNVNSSPSVNATYVTIQEGKWIPIIRKAMFLPLLLQFEEALERLALQKPRVTADRVCLKS